MLRSVIARLIAKFRVQHGLAMSLALFFASCSVLSPTSEPLSKDAKARMAAASDAINQGNFDQAREQIKNLKALPQTDILVDSVRSLEERLKGKELGVNIEKASSLKVDPTTASIGKPIQITLKLTNPEAKPLIIPSSSKSIPIVGKEVPGGMVGRLIVESVAFDPFGNQVRDRDMKTFNVLETLEIPPQGSWAQVSTIPAMLQDGFAFREFRIICELRPPRLVVDKDVMAPELITIGPAGFRVYPVGYESIVEHPLESLEKALANSDEKFDLHVFIAASRITDEQRKEAVKKCASSLSSPSRTRRRVVTVALRWLTGNNTLLYEEEAWKDWWRQHHQEYE